MRCFFNILAMIIVLAAFALPTGCQSPATIAVGPPKAAIVDQLYLRESNPELIAEATRILESFGFQVDVWQDADVTVDFYHRLPSLGYKFILLRAHSGLLVSMEDGQIVTLDTTYLFTAENYSTMKYVGDQLADKVSNAVMAEQSPLVFAVNSEFLKDAEGDFDRTVILAMGCESYKYDDLLAAFIEKGASVYVGWNDIVTLEHADIVISSLLGNLCTANMTLSQGIASTMQETGNDPYFNSYLKFYPPDSGDKTVAELIGK